jgi:hypothetical protein
MAYDKKKIYQQAVDAVSKNNLFFIEDIVAWLPCDKTTFYRFFPTESNEYNTLKGMLETNKTKTKSAIRSKLFKSNKASELLALYRLIATTEEHQKLNQSYVDHTSKGDKITQQPQFIVQNEEQSEKIQNWLDKLDNE